MERHNARAIAENLLKKVGDVDDAISHHLDSSLEAVKDLYHQKFLDLIKKTTGLLATLRYTIAFVVFDVDTVRILFASECACELFGLPLAQVIGESIFRFCRTGREEGGKEELAKKLDSLFRDGYWFGPGHLVSVKGVRTDVIAVTFFMKDAEGIVRAALLALPTETLRPFSDKSLEAAKKYYLEMDVSQQPEKPLP